MIDITNIRTVEQEVEDTMNNWSAGLLSHGEALVKLVLNQPHKISEEAVQIICELYADEKKAADKRLENIR